MESKRLLALDIGHKRTGVAISDDSRIIGLPLTQFEASHKSVWIKEVEGILKSHEDVGEIVVGIPLNHHGEEGVDAQKIREFIALLRERTNLPVIEWDERFTTIQAERSLISADVSRKDRKKVVDKVAATIILQSYLDSLKFHSKPWEMDP